MKKFNEVIEVQVSVDAIAEQLLSNIDPEFKHREMLAETIIGSALQDKNKLGISQIYNALNGYTNDIDFEVGEFVICDESTYSYKKDGTKDDGSIKYTEDYVKIGEATIDAIDVYAKNKLHIKYQKINSQGEVVTDSKWVSHLRCNKVNSYKEEAV